MINLKLFYSNNIRAVENAAEAGGFSTLRMMENAGSAAANVIIEKYKIKEASVIVVAGNGNNGGDGFVTARKLYEAGANVAVVLACGMPKSENASETLSKLSKLPVRIYNANDFEAKTVIKYADFVIDAIFGIGFRGELEGDVLDLVNVANESEAVRIALDLPSGCECDSGRVGNTCFSADVTISFIGVKPCHVLYPSSDYCGKLVMVGIGISKEIVDSASSDVSIIEDSKVKKAIPSIKKSAHKGSRGTALLVCGSYGMAGAAILSAKAALRSGAGLVKLALPNNVYPIAASALLEAVYLPCKSSVDGAISPDEFELILSNAAKSNAVLLGCGCGNTKELYELTEQLICNITTPVVIDADGINTISNDISILMKSKAPIVLTPHPAEMARLLNVDTEYVQTHRFELARAFAQKFAVTLVLKGSNTVIALKDGSLFVCMHGNPGMATGGSGDVLAGVIVSLIAQGLPPELAAVCGVNIHSAAGDIAANNMSMHSMLPSDIIDSLPQLFKKLES